MSWLEYSCGTLFIKIILGYATKELEVQCCVLDTSKEYFAFFFTRYDCLYGILTIGECELPVK